MTARRGFGGRQRSAGRQTRTIKTASHTKSRTLPNAEAYREYLRDLVARIDREMQTAGYPPFINPMMDRPFHLTVAHNKGGDPMCSVSDPPHHSQQPIN
jgi:hypothetical protein